MTPPGSPFPARRRVLAVALGAALTLVACAPQTSQARRVPPPGGGFRTTATPLQTIAATPMGSPSLSDGVLVSYVVESGEVVLRGWDAATGAVAWETPAFPGVRVPPGVELSASLVDVAGRTWAPHLKRGTSEADAVAAVDVATGEVVAADRLIVTNSRPYGCGESICVYGTLEGTTVPTEYAFDPPTGSLTARPGGATTPEGTFGFSGGLYATSVPGCESPPHEWACDALGFAVDGVSLWERPWRDIFGDDSSMAWGWWPVVWDDVPVIVFGGYSERLTWRNDTVIRAFLDVSQDRVVGLDKATGATVWQFDGADIKDTYEARHELVLAQVDAGALIREWNDDGTNRRLRFGLDGMRLLRVRAEDGTTVWEAPADAATIATLDDDPSYAASDKARFVDAGDGLVVVNLASGATIVPPADGIFPCGKRSWVTLPFSVYGDDSSNYNAGDAYWPCQADGITHVGEWSAAAVAFVASRDSADPTLAALATDSSILVFRLP